MTGRELLAQALALFAETETADYEALGLIYINMLLAETRAQNGRMLRHDGMEIPEGYQSIAALGDKLPCHERLAREALPWGLAAKLYFDEENNPRLSMFNEEYANRLQSCDRWVVDFGKSRAGGGFFA